MQMKRRSPLRDTSCLLSLLGALALGGCGRQAAASATPSAESGSGQLDGLSARAAARAACLVEYSMAVAACHDDLPCAAIFGEALDRCKAAPEAGSPAQPAPRPLQRSFWHVSRGR